MYYLSIHSNARCKLMNLGLFTCDQTIHDAWQCQVQTGAKTFIVAHKTEVEREVRLSFPLICQAAIMPLVKIVRLENYKKCQTILKVSVLLLFLGFSPHRG